MVQLQKSPETSDSFFFSSVEIVHLQFGKDSSKDQSQDTSFMYRQIEKGKGGGIHNLIKYILFCHTKKQYELSELHFPRNLSLCKIKFVLYIPQNTQFTGFACHFCSFTGILF